MGKEAKFKVYKEGYAGGKYEINIVIVQLVQ